VLRNRVSISMNQLALDHFGKNVLSGLLVVFSRALLDSMYDIFGFILESESLFRV